MEKSKSMTGVMQWPYRAVASALESLPRTLLANCGANTIRALTSLRAKHAAHVAAANASTGGVCTWGVNGETGELADMRSLGVWDPLVVKSQTYKTAIEVRSALSRNLCTRPLHMSRGRYLYCTCVRLYRTCASSFPYV